jgi:hypothetical protein
MEGYFLILPLLLGLTLTGYGALVVFGSTFVSGLAASFVLLVLTYYFFSAVGRLLAGAIPPPKSISSKFLSKFPLFLLGSNPK